MLFSHDLFKEAETASVTAVKSLAKADIHLYHPVQDSVEIKEQKNK